MNLQALQDRAAELLKGDPGAPPMPAASVAIASFFGGIAFEHLCPHESLTFAAVVICLLVFWVSVVRQ